MDFAQIVLHQLKALDLNINQAELSRGLPQGYIRGVVRDDEKRAVPNVQKAEQIAKALGLEFYIGPPRDQEPIAHVTLDGADYAHIPLHDAMLAAGAGACNGTEDVIDHLAFRRDWLQRIGVSASAARLARVHGDSMQPSLWPGDMILIDTRAGEPTVRGRDPRDQRRSPIYALIDNGEARVKRIERPTPDLMMLLSDNPDYAPELRHGDDMKSVQIIGKVVWSGHTHR
jgi:phage repressor protein C with HTH and peptisase S24 domain